MALSFFLPTASITFLIGLAFSCFIFSLRAIAASFVIGLLILLCFSSSSKNHSGSPSFSRNEYLLNPSSIRSFFDFWPKASCCASVIASTVAKSTSCLCGKLSPDPETSSKSGSVSLSDSDSSSEASLSLSLSDSDSDSDSDRFEAGCSETACFSDSCCGLSLSGITSSTPSKIESPKKLLAVLLSPPFFFFSMVAISLLIASSSSLSMSLSLSLSSTASSESTSLCLSSIPSHSSSSPPRAALALSFASRSIFVSLYC
ncbi:hypothetical protein OGATHE_006246 [Ogataea polymorpha]|uniref:Uncharacterized protein n=1 Tax=Ogataea polymorpha TaxID=460523 RepID=A0A9P8NU17_9ASCO|nr:hypothetical protein OGATHE_006246 [Ogataea polymorpha]